MAEEIEEKESTEPEPLTAKKIAEWMNKVVEKKGEIKQKTVVDMLCYRILGGKNFIHRNSNRNWAINEDVLEEFNLLNSETVVWEFARRKWRKRRKNDPEGRMVK